MLLIVMSRSGTGLVTSVLVSVALLSTTMLRGSIRSFAPTMALLTALLVIMVTAGNGGYDPALTSRQNVRLRAIRWRAQDGVARLLTRGRHHLLRGASHFIPMERPGAVIAAADEARAMIAR